MSDINNTTITIESVETKTLDSGSVMFKIKADKNYTLWKNKQDGSETKAYMFFKTLGLDAVGKTVDIGYTQKQRKYTTPTGEAKETTDYSIIAMKLAGAAPMPDPVIQVEPNQPVNTPPETLEARLKAVELKVTTLWGAYKARQTNEPDVYPEDDTMF